MGTTSLGLPYPDLTDAPDGPVQLQALAEATDGQLQLRALVAAHRAHEPDGPIGVPDSTWHPIAAYGDPANFIKDPSGLISFALGVYTLAAPGLWGYDGMIKWPAVDNTTPQHSRTLEIIRGGVEPTDPEGGHTVPWPSGAWGSWRQSIAGTVVATGTATTVQLQAYQTSGSYMAAVEASFTVYPIALT